MNINAIQEGISRGNYKITKVLETGEVVIALVSDFEKELLSKISDLSENEALEKISKFKKLTDKQSDELCRAYKANCRD